MLLAYAACAAAQQVEWVETARYKDGTTALLAERAPLKMQPMASAPASHVLEVDTSQKFQEILGFGGAFTEAAAINWKLLSDDDQKEVIRLYFAGPEDGGQCARAGLERGEGTRRGPAARAPRAPSPAPRAPRAPSPRPAPRAAATPSAACPSTRATSLPSRTPSTTRRATPT